jgi:succinoglycan biosynthesis transport protein ExoP
MNGDESNPGSQAPPACGLVVRAPDQASYGRRTDRSGYPYPAAEPLEEGGFGPAEYWRTLQRRKGTVLLAAFLGALTACLYTFPQTPVYQSRAVLEWQGLNENFLNMREVNPTTESGSASSPEYDIQTQIRILESRSLVERTAAKVGLGRKPLMLKPDRLSAWRRSLGLLRPDAGATPGAELEMAADSLKVRAQPNTRLMVVSCDSTDPRLAAGFVTTLVAEYIEQNLESRWKNTERTGEWLARQMEDVKIRLEKSDEALQSYARASGLIFTSEKNNVAEERLRELAEELSKAQADRVARQSKYETASRAAPESLPEVVDDAGLRESQTRLTDLRRQLAELAAGFTAEYPRFKRVQAQISALESALAKERDNIVHRIGNDFEAARRREQLIQAEYSAQAALVGSQADKVSHYSILKREVDTNRQLYDAMLQRVKEAGVAAALRASNIRTVDPARIPQAPYKPDVTVNTLLGLLAGFLTGAAFVVIRERSDRSLREPGDAVARLGVSELGVIPSCPSGRRFLSARGTQSVSNELALVTWERKLSTVAESFRAVLTSVILAGENGIRPRVLVVSSPNPGEGKTTVAANLAIALSEIDQRVLLIDADLRRPRLHEIFGLENEVGLAAILGGRATVWGSNGPVEVTHIPGLHVLPGGSSAETAPTLLYSPRMAELLRTVRVQFDTILIDAPPVLRMPDARVLGRLADSVILVVRAHRTTRDAAALACQRFAEDGTFVLGAVLNDWN